MLVDCDGVCFDMLFISLHSCGYSVVERVLLFPSMLHNLMLFNNKLNARLVAYVAELSGSFFFASASVQVPHF